MEPVAGPPGGVVDDRGVWVQGCGADMFVEVLIRERRYSESCPDYRRTGGSIDVLAESSTCRPGCCAYPGSVRDRMDVPPGLRLSPIRFSLPVCHFGCIL